MHPKSRLFPLAAVFLSCAPLPVGAAFYYWDGGTTDIATPGDGVSQGGSGTWGSVKNWDRGAGQSEVGWNKNATAWLAGTAGTVTLGSNVTAVGIQFETDGYTITGSQTLTLKTAGIVANGNATLTPALSLGSAQTWSVAADKQLVVNGTLALGTRALSLSGPGNLILSGAISGSGSINKNGSGLVTLSGVNTTTGSITLGDGILNVASAETAGTSGPLGKSGSLLFTGGTLQYSAANTADYSSRFSTGGSQLWKIDTNGRDVTYAAALAGSSSSLEKLGSGMLTLSGSSTFTGGTVVNAGTLRVSGSLATGGAVTVNAGTYEAASSHTVGQFTLASGAITGAGALTAASFDVAAGTISARLAGTGGLTKSTAGTVTLSSASTYTGGTNINAGNLIVTGGLADTGAVAVNGGTYTVNSSDTIGALTLTSGLINGTSTLTASSYAVQSGTISAQLAGSAGLTKSTSGTVHLSGTNLYTGATQITGGVLNVTGSLAAGSTVAVAAGGTLSGSGSVAGAVTVANSTSAIIAPGSGGSGTLTLANLTFAGAGTVEFGSLAQYTTAAALRVNGALTLSGSGGAVRLNLPAGVVAEGTYHLIASSLTDLAGFSVTGGNLGGRQLAALVASGGNISYVVTGATPYWTGAAGNEWSTTTQSAPKNWALSPTATTDFLQNDAVIFDDRGTASTVVLSGTVSPKVVGFSNETVNYTVQGAGSIAAGAVTKSGAGRVTLATANSYSGGTTLYSGTLAAGHNAAFGTGSLILQSGTLTASSTATRTLANNIVLQGNVTLGDAVTSGTLDLAGTVDLGASSRTLTVASDVIFSGAVSNGGLVKSGNGVLSLNGANTYSGGTVIQAGTIGISSLSSLGAASGSLTFAGNGTLRANANLTTSRSIIVNSGITATIDTNGLALSHNGILSGSGALVKSGAGTLTLSGANTHSGAVSVQSGTLAVAGGAAIADSATVSLANTAGASFRLEANETIGSLSGGGTTGGTVDLGSSTLTLAGAQSAAYSGAISGTGHLVKSGTGTLTLAGSSTFTGTTRIAGGVLSIASDAALGTAPAAATAGQLTLAGGTLAATSSFTLATNRGLTTGGTIQVDPAAVLTYGGVAAGTGFLTKSGDGTLVLGGANTYTGSTTIAAGTLMVNGSLASAVTVATGATLGGTGRVNGSVTVQDDGTILVGNGTSGTLTIGGALTFGLDGAIAIGGLSNYTSTTALVVGGGLSVGSAVTFELPVGLISNGTYRLASFSGNPNANNFVVSGPVTGARQTANLNSSGGLITYVVAGDTPRWTGAADANWNSAASNWRLITGGGVTQFLANDDVLFDDAATGSTTVNLASAVSPLITRFANSTKDYTLQGAGGIASGSLTKTGTGRLTISTANTYIDGTTLTDGRLQLGHNSALGTGTVTLNGGTLSAASSAARTIGNALAIGGNVTLGDATLNGQLTFTGGVNLGGASRQLTTASDVAMNGALSNGGLVKTGAGTLTLGGASSYAGSTTVNAGKLVVNGSLANASLQVNSGATLGGSGAVAGATLLSAGAMHSPGNSPGIQSFESLTYADGSIFVWEIDRTKSQVRGTGYDGVNVSGALAGLDGPDENTTTDAIFRIVIGDNDFSDSFWNTPRQWTDIFTGADGATAKADWATIFGGGFQFYNTAGAPIAAPAGNGFTLSGNTLSWSAVPEPGSALVGLLLGVGWIRRRRR